MDGWRLETPRLMLRVKRPGDPLPYVDEHRDHEARFGFGVWALVDRATGAVVGEAGLLVCDEGIELGLAVRADRRGRGLATEAGAAVLDHAFATLELERVLAFVDEDNAASRRVAEKLGMALVRRDPGDDEVPAWRAYVRVRPTGPAAAPGA